MTNLEIIKYLATNNPARLAELLDDLYCNAWNCGNYAQVHIAEEKFSPYEMEFSESKWPEQEANTDFFFDEELEEWSKAINNPSIEITYPDHLVIELPWEGKDPNHMWNTDNNFNIISKALEEMELLANIMESEEYPDSVYNSFRKEVCAGCANANQCLQSQMAIVECSKFDGYYEVQNEEIV